MDLWAVLINIFTNFMTTFLERYFHKSTPEDIQYSDLEQFISLGIEENLNLEYKGNILVRKDGTSLDLKNDHKVGFTGLARSVSSMANAAGGLLILGVEEVEEQLQKQTIRIRPGKITPLPPLITKELIEQHLNSKIQYQI
jgi:predicted HTH transcriptional regulator